MPLIGCSSPLLVPDANTVSSGERWFDVSCNRSDVPPINIPRPFTNQMSPIFPHLFLPSATEAVRVKPADNFLRPVCVRSVKAEPEFCSPSALCARGMDGGGSSWISWSTMMSLGRPNSLSFYTVSEAVCGNWGLSDQRNHLGPFCACVHACMHVCVHVCECVCVRQTVREEEIDTVLE